jgi:hypothetical protein
VSSGYRWRRLLRQAAPRDGKLDVMLEWPVTIDSLQVEFLTHEDSVIKTIPSCSSWEIVAWQFGNAQTVAARFLIRPTVVFTVVVRLRGILAARLASVQPVEASIRLTQSKRRESKVDWLGH